MMRVALSLDHRMVDGGYGAKFLQDLNEALGKDCVQEIFNHSVSLNVSPLTQVVPASASPSILGQDSLCPQRL
jgi:hypothetical protein